MRTRRAPARRGLLAACALAGTAVLAGTAALAGCGGPQAGTDTAPSVTISADPQLAVSLPTSAGAWATVPMGRSGTNLFWELLRRPAGTARWTLVTPPGVADNGGLVVAASGDQALSAGFRPSQHLTFSPLAATADGGRTWAALPGVLPGGLAAVPDALAAGPGGKLLGLTAAGGGTVYSAASGGSRWAEVTTATSLAAQPAARTCGVSALTAVAVTASGTPLAGAACGRAGTAGIFAMSGSSWQPAGPALPAALRGATVQVLRLTTTPAGTAAVLSASTPGGTSVVGARAGGSTAGGPGGHWALTAPLETGTAQVVSAGPGPGGQLYVLFRASGSTRLEMCQTPGSLWQCFPALPTATATVVPGPPGQVQALAVQGSRLTVWAATAADRSWTAVQTMNVKIPYGTSG
jgi:hypothetical protein